MYEIIKNAIEICFQKGVKYFVICPGSRSAPLTITLARHPQIKTIVIADERAAAYTALGMALQTKETIGLVCTSGTAVLNFAPAIAEAFFQEIPLLIFTADRPAEWIAQQDGQTLFQRDVYGKNIKASFEFPSDYNHKDSVWLEERIINEAINLTQQFPKGPTHINFPLREPLYPTKDQQFIFNKNVKIVNRFQSHSILLPDQWQQIFEIWEDAERKLIVVGQQDLDEELSLILKHLQEDWEIPVIGDVISNVHHLNECIRHQDLFLMNTNENFLNKLKPDLLITFGKSLISKNLKSFLRNYKPEFHFHIQPAGNVADTFQTLTHCIPTEPNYFFTTLYNDLDFIKYQSSDESELNPEYHELWKTQDRIAFNILNEGLNESKFSEFKVVQKILENVPGDSILHLSNSMPVRYANFLSLNSNKKIEIFANRGTSGIDGCTSTAIGAAKMTDKIVILITGDMAFFYDRNALWQNNIPHNLKIIILNNHGGGIFRMIDAGSQPELEKFFETKNLLTAANTAKDFNLDYYFCNTEKELDNDLISFFTISEKAKILEIETDVIINTEVYNKIKNSFKHI